MISPSYMHFLLRNCFVDLCFSLKIQHITYRNAQWSSQMFLRFKKSTPHPCRPQLHPSIFLYFDGLLCFSWCLHLSNYGGWIISGEWLTICRGRSIRSRQLEVRSNQWTSAGGSNGVILAYYVCFSISQYLTSVLIFLLNYLGSAFIIIAVLSLIVVYWLSWSYAFTCTFNYAFRIASCFFDVWYLVLLMWLMGFSYIYIYCLWFLIEKEMLIWSTI